MSDDFVRLVSQANPASRNQYQPANTGYPPSSSPPQALDPFFDDDDDVPDSAFGRPPAMQSKESGLPFAGSGAPPAGVGNSQLSLPTTIAPDQWSFDDDDVPKTFPGSKSFPGPSRGHERKPSKSAKRKWKFNWPWQKKEKVLTGNRVIALNNSDANADFCNNYVSTSKYNVATFVPKFLFGTWTLLICCNMSDPRMCRAILEVRQPVLLVHRSHPANTRRVTHQPIYHYCPPCCCIASIRVQRDSGGSGELLVLLIPPFPPLRAYAADLSLWR